MKKIACLLTRVLPIGAMCVSALFSCANGDSSENKVSEVSTETTPTETTGYIDTLPKVDYGGADFTIIGQNFNPRQNFFIEELEGDTCNDALHERDVAVSERLNLNLVYISMEKRLEVADTVKRAVSAGEEAYQLVFNSISEGMNTLTSAGMLYDLTEIPYLTLDSELWNKSMLDNMSFGGALYFSTGPISLQYFMTPNAMLMNQRLAADYGIDDIYATVKDGNWTVDLLYSYIKDMAQDLNNDGKMDENDFYGLDVEGTFGNILFNSSGVSSVDEDMRLTLDSARAMDVIDKLSGLFGDRNVVYNDQYASGTITKIFRDGNALFMNSAILGITAMRDMNDDFAIIPTPKYDASQEGYITTSNTWCPSGVGVPKNCSDPDRTGLVMETMAYYSNLYLSPAVYEVTLQGKVARDDDSSVMLDLIFEGSYFDMVTAFNFKKTAEMVRDAVLGETKNFASKYAAIKNSAQAEIDKIIDGSWS